MVLALLASPIRYGSRLRRSLLPHPVPCTPYPTPRTWSLSAFSAIFSLRVFAVALSGSTVCGLRSTVYPSYRSSQGCGEPQGGGMWYIRMIPHDPGNIEVEA